VATAIIGGYHLEYEVAGPMGAPALVLSNSLGADLHMWDAQAAALQERWRVVRYDTRGHGRSSVTPGPYTIARLADDVAALLDYLDIRLAHFCGLSLGGLTGLAFAHDHAERLLKLVVCCSAARIGTTATWDARIAAVRRGGMGELAPSIIARWFTDEFRARDPVVVQRIEQQLLATPSEGYAACCGALRDTDLRPSVSAIRAPTLMIAGSVDPVVPLDDVRWLADHIPGARFAELPTAHLANVEAPTSFNETLSSFLAN
jgi:3-oxoadipate enol-lactonase